MASLTHSQDLHHALLQLLGRLRRLTGRLSRLARRRGGLLVVRLRGRGLFVRIILFSLDAHRHRDPPKTPGGLGLEGHWRAGDKLGSLACSAAG